ncbi:MAG: thiamine pyrophosphate-binding protein, partial [Anaerolineales bacterium]
MKIYGGRLVARTIKRFGVRHLFSLPGHQILSVYDACLDEAIDLISTRHEASAVFMAQALSFVEHEAQVVLLAGGPELTNALTAIAQAYYANTPLVVISGTNTFKKRDKGFPQDMDQLQVVRPFTKWARTCHDVYRIPEYIAAAFRYAARGRPGPTYVEIPYDVLETKVDINAVSFPTKPKQLRPCGDKDSLETLVSMLEKARRPVAIAGSGALWSGAEAELQTFIEKTGIPLTLASAALAMPFPAQKVSSNFGIIRPFRETVAEADLILLLGTRMNFGIGFGQAPFFTSSQKIAQIDIHPEEIDTNRPIDLGITGDLKATLAALNDMHISMKSLAGWHQQVSQKTRAYEAELRPLAESNTCPIHPLRLVSDLESLRSDDSFLVLDGANSILWALMAAKPHPEGGVLISSLGELQAIGAGVPQTIALKRRFPQRQVILHTGDGSFGYGLVEMETALRYNIPIVVVIHNDQGWGMTRDMQTDFFGKDRGIGNQLGVVRYDRLVEGFGGHGEFVQKPDQLKPALERALGAGKPACVNVMVDPLPKSPGLKTFMLMEVMLGKETYLDRIP